MKLDKCFKSVKNRRLLHYLISIRLFRIGIVIPCAFIFHFLFFVPKTHHRLDDKSGDKDQGDDEPAEEDIGFQGVSVRLAIDTAATHEVDQIPGEKPAQDDRRDHLDGWKEPPSRHLEALRVSIDLIKDLRRMEEPSGNDYLENTRQKERVAVDEIVHDIEDRKTCAGHIDEADDTLDDTKCQRRLFLIQMELVRDRRRNAFDNGEQGVDRQCDQTEVEDKGEDHVDYAASGELDDRLGIDDKCGLDSGCGHIIQHADARHGREHDDTCENADDHVRKCDDDGVHRDICFFVEKRTVREHDGHRCRE